MAVRNCNAFFEKKDRTKLDWDRISVVPLNDYPYVLSINGLGEKTDPYFSPLDRWAHVSFVQIQGVP